MKLLMHLFPEFFPFEQHDPDQEQEADSDSDQTPTIPAEPPRIQEAEAARPNHIPPP